MESNKTSSIGKLALIFLGLFIIALLLAYDATATTQAEIDGMNNATALYYEFEEAALNYVTQIGTHDFDSVSGGIPDRTTGIIDFGQDFEESGPDQIYVSSAQNYPFDRSTNFSVSGWYTVESLQGRWGFGDYDFNDGDSNNVFNLGYNDGITITGYACGFKPTIIAAVIPLNSWFHVAFRKWGNDTVEFFVNGSLVAAGQGAGCNNNHHELVIGRLGNVQEWDGVYDEIGIFNISLTDGMLEHLWSNGNITDQYPFSLAPTPAANFTITAVDAFNGSNIISFNATINGTDYASNSSGIIGTDLFLNNTNPVNITIWGATDYFNRTYQNYDINNEGVLQAALHQAEARLNITEKITNNSLSGVTFYIGAFSGTEFNLSTGTHTVIAEKSGYYNYTGSITVPALTNTSYTLEGMYNTILNFTAFNALSFASVSNFRIDIDFGESISTTNGSVYMTAINNTNYTFNISSPGLFTTRNNLTFETNSSLHNINTSLYTFNSIRINIFNETDMLPMTQSVLVNTISNLTTFSNTTTNGFINIELLFPTTYELRFESVDFNPRSIFLTVTNDSTQNISVYLTANETTELQRIEVLDTANQPVEGAVVWLQKEKINISDHWITIQEAQTDYNGETSVFVIRDVTTFYRFAVIYEGEARPIQPSGNLFTGPTSFIPGIEETIQLIVDLEENPVDFISDDLAIAVDCNMTNTTAICTIIDGRNSITGAELRLEASYINESLAWENITTDSFLGSSGTLQVNITAINNSIWRARAYVLYEDSESLVWEDEYRFDIDVIINKNTGLLYAFIVLAVVAALTVMWGPLPSGLVTVCALIPLMAIKIISLPIGVITGLLALVIIFFVRTKKK